MNLYRYRGLIAKHHFGSPVDEADRYLLALVTSFPHVTSRQASSLGSIKTLECIWFLRLVSDKSREESNFRRLRYRGGILYQPRRLKLAKLLSGKTTRVAVR